MFGPSEAGENIVYCGLSDYQFERLLALCAVIELRGQYVGQIAADLAVRDRRGLFETCGGVQEQKDEENECSGQGSQRVVEFF